MKADGCWQVKCCLRLASDGKQVVVTEYGKTVAIIIPIDSLTESTTGESKKVLEGKDFFST